MGSAFDKKFQERSTFDKKFAEKTAPPPEEISKLESGVRGAAKGFSFGLRDEAQGVIRASIDWLSGKLDDNEKLKSEGFSGDIGPSTWGEAYDHYRDEERGLSDAAEKANPKTFTGGQVAGGLTTAIATGGSAAAAGAGRAAQVGLAAGEGALAGFGESEGDIKTQLKDTAKGAAIGGALGGTGEYGKQVFKAGKRKFVKLVDETFGKLSDETKEFVSKNSKYFKEEAEIGKLGDEIDVAQSKFNEATQKVSDLKTERVGVKTEKAIKDASYEATKLGKNKEFLDEGADLAADYANDISKKLKEAGEKIGGSLDKTPDIESGVLRKSVLDLKKLAEITIGEGDEAIKQARFGIDPRVTKELTRLRNTMLSDASKDKLLSESHLYEYVRGLDDLIDYGGDTLGGQGKEILFAARDNIQNILKERNSAFAEAVEEYSKDIRVLDEVRSTYSLKGNRREGFKSTDATRRTLDNIDSATSGASKEAIGRIGPDVVLDTVQKKREFFANLKANREALKANLEYLTKAIAEGTGDSKLLKKKLDETKKLLKDINTVLGKTKVSIDPYLAGGAIASGNPALGAYTTARGFYPGAQKAYHAGGALRTAVDTGGKLIDSTIEGVGTSISRSAPEVAQLSIEEKNNKIKKKALKAIKDYK